MPSAAATEVHVANREAMQRLAHGDLTSARFELDRAHEALALLESEASSEWLNNDSNVPSGANQSNAAVKSSQESSLGYLRSLTHNNDASWWRARGDLGRAVECLSKSLEESDARSGVPLQQLASTHSNLCAVLSQMGRHDLALEYARTAVVHCRSALSEAEEAQQWEAKTGAQPPSTDTKNPKEGAEDNQGTSGVLSTLAVACHNLAVELEFVDGPSASIKWYQQAVRVAARAQDETSQASGAPSASSGSLAASSGLSELRSGLEAALTSALKKSERNDRGQRRLSSSSSASIKPNKLYDMKMAPPWAPRTRDAVQSKKCGLLVTPTPLSNLNTQRWYSGPTGDGADNDPAVTKAAVTRHAQRTSKAAAAASGPPAFSNFDFGDFWDRDATVQFMTPSADNSNHREKNSRKDNGHKLHTALNEHPSKDVANLSPLEQAALSPETAMSTGAAESRASAAAQRRLQEANELNAMRRPGGHLEGPETARREALRRHEGRWSPPPASRPPNRQASDDASSGWPSHRESPFHSQKEQQQQEHLLRRSVTPPMPAFGAAQALTQENLAAKDARLRDIASTATAVSGAAVDSGAAAAGQSSPTSDQTSSRQQQIGRPPLDDRSSMAKARLSLGIPLEVGYATQPSPHSQTSPAACDLRSFARSATPPPLNLQGQPVAAGRWLQFQQEQNELRERAATAPGKHRNRSILPHFAPPEDDGYGGRRAAANRLLSARQHRNKQPVKPNSTRPSSATSSTNKPYSMKNTPEVPGKHRQQEQQPQNEQSQSRRCPGSSQKGKSSGHRAATNYAINSRGIPVPISAVSLPLNTSGLMSNGVNSGVGQAAWLRFNARGLPVSVRPEAAPEAAMNPPRRRNGQKNRKTKHSDSLNEHVANAVPPRQMALAYESAKAAALLALSSQEGHDQPGGFGTADQSGNALAVGAASLALRALRETLGASQHPNEGSQYSFAAAALAAPTPGIFRPLSPSEQRNQNEGPVGSRTGAEEEVGEAAASEPLETEDFEEDDVIEAGGSLSPPLRHDKDANANPQSKNVDDGDSPSSDKGDGRAMVGRTVQKEFGEDGWFAGSVVAATWLESAGAWQYEVLYEDGDVELLDFSELNAIIGPAEVAARPNEEAAAPSNETNVSAGLTAAIIANDGGNGPAKGEDSGNASEEGKVQGGQGGGDGRDASNPPPPSAFQSFPTPDLKPSQEGAAATANVAAAAVPIADMSVEQMMVLNLQRQLQAAQAEGDSEKASALNDKLGILQGALGV